MLVEFGIHLINKNRIEN